MKRTKKLFAVVLAFVLTLAMAVTAFAAEKNFSITITNPENGHTYEAYQIFAGTVSENGGTLSNVTWGNGVTDGAEQNLGAAATKAESLKSVEQAEAFAKEVSKYLNKQNAKQSTPQNGSYKIENLDPGYYLVKDMDDSMTDQNDFYTAYLMKVVGNATATPKGEKPTLEKEIKNNQSGAWGNVADHQVGEEVEFRIITSIPNYDFTKYENYKHIIHDTFSTGLTLKVTDNAGIEIKINDEAGNGTVLAPQYYTVEVVNNGVESFKVTIDVKKARTDGIVKGNDKLYTYYKATVNQAAHIYDGNNTDKQENKAYLEYTNNPYGEETGKTVEKKVYDWSFQITLKKIKENKEDLQGAKFVLSTDASLDVKKLVDKDGALVDTNKLIGFVNEGGNSYRVATAAEKSDTYEVDAGTAQIKGLDGNKEYYLYETKAPDGYNMLTAPVKVKIVPSYSADGSNIDTVKTEVGTESANGLEVHVTNKAGTTLPETGGVGTTIFYVMGSLLLVGAAVILVTGKRMKNSAENH